MLNVHGLRSLLGWRLLRASLAAVLIALSVRELHERYFCMVPWQDYGLPMEPQVFIAISIAFFVGFVWLIAEVVVVAGERVGLSSASAGLFGVAGAMALYVAIIGIAWAVDPVPSRIGSPMYRRVLSASWAAGYLQQSGHYSSVECGY